MPQPPLCKNCNQIFSQDNKPIRSFACMKDSTCQYLICEKCFDQIQQCPQCQNKYNKKDQNYAVDSQLFQQIIKSQEQKNENKTNRVLEYYKELKPTLEKLFQLKICIIQYFKDAIDQLKNKKIFIDVKFFLNCLFTGSIFIPCISQIGMICKQIFDPISIFVDQILKNQSSEIFMNINQAIEEHDKYLNNPMINLLLQQLAKIKYIEIYLKKMKGPIQNQINIFQAELNQFNPLKDLYVSCIALASNVYVMYKQEELNQLKSDKINIQQEGSDHISDNQQVKSIQQDPMITSNLELKEIGDHGNQQNQGYSEIAIESQKQFQSKVTTQQLYMNNKIMIYNGPSKINNESSLSQPLHDNIERKNTIMLYEGPSNKNNESPLSQPLQDNIEKKNTIMLYEGPSNKNNESPLSQPFHDNIERKNTIMLYEGSSELNGQNEIQQQCIVEPQTQIEQKGMETIENQKFEQLYNQEIELDQKILEKEQYLRKIEIRKKAYKFYEVRNQSSIAIQYLQKCTQDMEGSLDQFQDFIQDLENLRK
ncbi:hypothetical protein pb186bvf_003378 [Paramecium bursaria]